MQQPVDATRCNHKTWINSATNDTPQWIPCSFIEPIQKIIETMLYHISRGTIIEPKRRKKKQIEKKAKQSAYTLVTMDQIHELCSRILLQQTNVMKILKSMPITEQQMLSSYCIRLFFYLLSPTLKLFFAFYVLVIY